MKVLTTTKKIKHKNYTYRLMKSDSGNEYVHINNHKTNDKSITVPASALAELLREVSND